MSVRSHRGVVRRPSVADVARLAGVSVGTVSNVLNRPEYVTEKTRAKVLAAIDELSFVRNASARQLREGRVRSVGAIVLDLTNPFFTEMARGVEDRLAQEGYALMVGSSDENPQREARIFHLFEEHGVQGMLVTPSHGALENVMRARDRGADVVLLDHTSPVPDLSSVAVDDVRGAELAVQHLLANGHERIAFLNGPSSIRQCVDRREGAVRAIVAAGMKPEEVLVEIPIESLNAAGGHRGMSVLLARADPVVTAAFCVNDFTALGALRCLRESGRHVPTDMALVGYDDVNFAAELATPLTSVRQPAHKIGWTAADLLLRTPHEVEQIVFQPELVIRGSSRVG